MNFALYTFPQGRMSESWTSYLVQCLLISVALLQVGMVIILRSGIREQQSMMQHMMSMNNAEKKRRRVRRMALGKIISTQ